MREKERQTATVEVIKRNETSSSDRHRRRRKREEFKSIKNFQGNFIFHGNLWTIITELVGCMASMWRLKEMWAWINEGNFEVSWEDKLMRSRLVKIRVKSEVKLFWVKFRGFIFDGFVFFIFFLRAKLSFVGQIEF